jgi:AcrR family transcriptional regulator
LDACSALLADHDYDDITTARIAEVAGVPIGSFYQYFPDKRSVLHTIALNGMERYLGEVTELFSSGELSVDWRRAVEQVVDVYLRMQAEIPGFGRVRFSDMLDGHRLDASVDQYELMAERLAELFVDRFGSPGSAPVVLTFRMAVQTADSLLKLADRVHGDERFRVFRTTHGVICGMLAEVLDPQQEHATCLAPGSGVG